MSIRNICTNWRLGGDKNTNVSIYIKAFLRPTPEKGHKEMNIIWYWVYGAL